MTFADIYRHSNVGRCFIEQQQKVNMFLWLEKKILEVIFTDTTVHHKTNNNNEVKYNIKIGNILKMWFLIWKWF